MKSSIIDHMLFYLYPLKNIPHVVGIFFAGVLFVSDTFLGAENLFTSPWNIRILNSSGMEFLQLFHSTFLPEYSQ